MAAAAAAAGAAAAAAAGADAPMLPGFSNHPFHTFHIYSTSSSLMNNQTDVNPFLMAFVGFLARICFLFTIPSVNNEVETVRKRETESKNGGEKERQR